MFFRNSIESSLASHRRSSISCQCIFCQHVVGLTVINPLLRLEIKITVLNIVLVSHLLYMVKMSSPECEVFHGLSSDVCWEGKEATEAQSSSAVSPQSASPGTSSSSSLSLGRLNCREVGGGVRALDQNNIIDQSDGGEMVRCVGPT